MANSIFYQDGNIYLISGSLSSSISTSIVTYVNNIEADISGTLVTQSHVIFPNITGSEFVASFQLDPNDPKSFYISGSNTSASLYMSSSGRLGFGTTNPESEFDIRTDDFKIRKRGIASGIRMNEDGNLESFNNDTNSATTGSEVILKYTRGTSLSVPSGKRKEDLRDVDFYKKTITQANDTLGSIRWVADSGSLDQRSAGEAGNIKMQVASADATGVTGKLSINLAADPGAASQQLYLINGATQVHAFTGAATFSSNVTVTGNITANGNIIGDDATDITNINQIGCDEIFHDGDTDTKITFTDDDINITVGGMNMLDFTEGDNDEITFNESAQDLDIRIEGEADSKLFFTDASTSRVGIGTNSPSYKLDVHGDTRITGSLTATSLDISGDVDVDGTLEADALTIGGTNILTGGIVTTLGTIGGAINFNSQRMTNVDIDSGTIDGVTIARSNITVGADVTLDTRNGTLNISAAQRKTIIEGAASNIDIGAYELRAQTFESDVATGTAPLTIASTTVVSNLNADKLDGADLVDEDDMTSDSATKVPTQQSVKAYVDARKSVLRSQSFYINDNPFIQNSLYFGGTLNHQADNWNDPQAIGGDPMTVSSFDISDDDQNWGMIIPYNISKIEILCGLRPGGTQTDQFSLVLYTASRSTNVSAITLTRVAQNGVNFLSGGKYQNNDLTYTADINAGTMIYVGVGTNTSSPVAKNARGYMSITITQR